MIPKELELRDQYAGLSDEQLVSVALRGPLTSEAQGILDSELRLRGITDLNPWKKAKESDRARLEARYQEKMNGLRRWRRWVRRGMYALSAFCVLNGCVFFLVPQLKWGDGDGGAFIATGVVFALLGWAWSMVSALWHEKVLGRRWWV